MASEEERIAAAEAEVSVIMLQIRNSRDLIGV